MTLKIKDKKKFGRNCIEDNIVNKKICIEGVCLLVKDPDPFFTGYGSGGPKRPDPQHFISVHIFIHSKYPNIIF